MVHTGPYWCRANVRRMHAAERLNDAIVRRSAASRLVLLDLPAPPPPPRPRDDNCIHGNRYHGNRYHGNDGLRAAVAMATGRRGGGGGLDPWKWGGGKKGKMWKWGQKGDFGSLTAQMWNSWRC